MGDDFATKKDVEHLGAALRQELASNKDVQNLGGTLRGEIEALGEALRGEMAAQGEALRHDLATKKELLAMEQRLSFQIAHAIHAGIENVGSMIGALDDKYTDLPAKVAEVRRDLDEHRTSSSLHLRPEPSPQKRVRKRAPAQRSKR